MIASWTSCHLVLREPLVALSALVLTLDAMALALHHLLPWLVGLGLVALVANPSASDSLVINGAL